MVLANMINDAMSKHREKVEEKRRREEEERRWVDERPETEMICNYMECFMDKKQPGYLLMKQLRKQVDLSVLGDRIRLTWDDPKSLDHAAQSFRDVAMAGKLAMNQGTKDITFREIYNWYGDSDPDYYRALGTETLRLELQSRILEKLKGLPHLKVSYSTIGIRPFH